MPDTDTSTETIETLIPWVAKPGVIHAQRQMSEGMRNPFGFRVGRSFTMVTVRGSGSTTRRLTMGQGARPEHLVSASFLRPSTLRLKFTDKTFLLRIEDLGMPVDRIRWDTAKETPSGNAMNVTAIKGELIPIDSATLRYLVDKDYAAKIDAALENVRLSDEELRVLARDSQPPAQWYDQPEDLRLESWK